MKGKPSHVDSVCLLFPQPFAPHNRHVGLAPPLSLPQSRNWWLPDWTRSFRLVGVEIRRWDGVVVCKGSIVTVKFSICSFIQQILSEHL